MALSGSDGRKAEALLAESVRQGSAILSELARQAVARLIESDDPLAATVLFNEDERQQLADQLRDTNATAELLGRSRILLRAEQAERFHAEKTRAFYDPSQSRDDQGQWGSGGGGASISAKTGESPAKTKSGAAKRKFVTVTNPKDFGNAHFSEWATGLSEGEKAAIDFYKKDSTPINETLREGTGFRYEKVEQAKKAMTRAIAKSSVPHDMVAYRGARAEFYEGLSEGNVFRDAGFISTSVDKDIVDTFGDPNGEGHKIVKIAIMVPKGAHAGYVSQHNNDDFSNEMILQRGSKFKVMKRKGNWLVLKMIPRRRK